jgi:hypothetical protein
VVKLIISTARNFADSHSKHVSWLTTGNAASRHGRHFDIAVWDCGTRCADDVIPPRNDTARQADRLVGDVCVSDEVDRPTREGQGAAAHVAELDKLGGVSAHLWG